MADCYDSLTKVKLPIFLSALPIFLATGISMLAADLCLPAIPLLPNALRGDEVGAQCTLAAFFATFALGQLVFGALADRYDRRWILTGGLSSFAAVSVACALAWNMTALIWLRAAQGLAASAGTAVTPALLREAGDDQVVVRLIAMVSSLESALPILAPILGAWLVLQFGWASTFWLMALVAVLSLIALGRARIPAAPPHNPERPPAYVRYLRLMCRRRFMGYQLSHASSLSAWLVFIMAAPYLMVSHLGHATSAFVIMQVVLTMAFVVSANRTGSLSKRFGIDRVIVVGAVLQLISGLAFGLLVGFREAWLGPFSLTVSMLPMVIGMGLRMAPGFTRAMSFAGPYTGTAGGLMRFTAMGLSALGTQVVAPSLPNGPGGLVVVQLGLCLASIALLPVAMKPEMTPSSRLSHSR